MDKNTFGELPRPEGRCFPLGLGKTVSALAITVIKLIPIILFNIYLPGSNIFIVEPLEFDYIKYNLKLKL